VVTGAMFAVHSGLMVRFDPQHGVAFFFPLALSFLSITTPQVKRKWWLECRW